MDAKPFYKKAKKLLDKYQSSYYNNSSKRFAAVVESADTRDLKSLEVTFVPVQVRSAAPPS